MDFIKVFDPNEDRVIERRELLTYEEISEVAEENPGMILLVGDKEKISDIEGFRTAYQNISNIKKPDESNKALSNFYFGFIEETVNDENGLIVCFIPIEDWNKNLGKKTLNGNELITAITKPTEEDEEFILSKFDMFTPIKDKGLVFRADDYNTKKGADTLYTYLMEDGAMFSKAFDDYLDYIAPYLTEGDRPFINDEDDN